MKRFYRSVAVEAEDDGFGILLDGRRLRTPSKRKLLLPTPALAEALAAEWDAQESDVVPDTMGIMKLASTALDRVIDVMPAVADEAAKFGATDLLCYRADGPADLVRRQHEAWQPLLDWAAWRHDAPLRVVTGLMPGAQPAASLRALRLVLDRLDALRLTAVADLTACCGSLVLALAVLDRRIDAGEAFALSQLDESWQIERWGLDDEAAERRRRIDRDIAVAARFLTLLEA